MNKTFISIFLFLLIFSVTFELTAFDNNLQKRLVEKHSKRENKLDEHQKVLEFFKTNNLELNITKEESSHMRDVKKLNDNFILFILILTIITGLLIYFNKSIEILTKLWIPLAIATILSITSIIFPAQIFSLFHLIFFPQGNFLFSFDSFLITLYPANYFYELFYNVLLRTTIATLLLIILGYLLKKRFIKLKKHDK